MARSWNKPTFLIVTFGLSVGAVILCGVAFGTSYWVSEDVTVHADSPGGTAIGVNLHIGLFEGEWTKTVIRTTSPIKLKDEYNKNEDFMNFAVWVLTILCLALSMVFGVTTCIFSAINSALTPIEEITGITGIYLWNGLACLFNLLTVLLYIGQYCNYFVHILESLQDTLSINNAVDLNQPSSLDYSFYLVCGSNVIYIVNNLFIYFSSIKLEPKKKTIGPQTDPHEGGIIMLY